MAFVANNSNPNGRSESSHGCLSYFSSNFNAIDPPKPTDKDYDKKMKASVVAEFNRGQRDIGHPTMGASTFRRHLAEKFPRVGICPHKQDYCDKCRSLDIEIKRSLYIMRKTKESGNATEQEIRRLEEEIICHNKEKELHLTDAKEARGFFNKMTERCKEDWESAIGDELMRHRFTLVLSADYQQAKLIPYWGHSPQPGSTYYLMKHSNDIFGIVDHRDNSGHTFIFGEELGPKNTDHTVSLLQKYITSVQKKYPWINRLLLFLDNATSTNKNRFLISWAMEMVEQQILSSIHICFLAAGHTKFSPDRMFASCSKTYNATDVFNQQELTKIYSHHSTA